MSVKHGILGILADGPRHGYELKTQFDGLTGGLWDLNVGQIYSTLERMRKDGLVALEESGEGADERKTYRVTDAGREELDGWLQAPPLRPRPLRDEFFVQLGLLIDRNRPAALALINGVRRVHHLRLASLTRQKVLLARSQERGRIHRELLLDAALLHVEADLTWLDRCEERLGALGGGPQAERPPP